MFGWQPEDAAPQRLAKLEAGLGGFKTLPLSESVRLFADLMSVTLPEDRRCRVRLPVVGPVTTLVLAAAEGFTSLW